MFVSLTWFVREQETNQNLKASVQEIRLCINQISAVYRTLCDDLVTRRIHLKFRQVLKAS